MVEERYWLIDAQFEENEVTLAYIRSPEGSIETFQDNYAPSFFGLPASTGVTVVRKELMSGKQLEVARIPRTSTITMTREWERDLDPAMSFIIDQHLRFGSPHKQTSTGMLLDLAVPQHYEKAFDQKFGGVKEQDPLKFQFLQKFFQLAIQPIPPIPRKPLNIDESTDDPSLFWGIMLSRIANIPFQRALKSRSVSEWIRSMLHTSYRDLGILIPDPEELKKGHKPHRVEGALTIAPKPGAYFHMTVLDFESLYPSIIDRYNLSYETVDCGHSECQENQVPGTPHYVCTQRRGIYSALLGALKDLRIYWFKPQSRRTDIPQEERDRAKILSDLLKFLLVSSGGVTIRIQGLACPPFAESMMAYGRWSLQTSWDWAEGHGMRPVYGDTDSLFLDHPTQEQVDWLISKAKKELNLVLAVDVIYPLCVLSAAKKAYFGILSNGDPDIKGITLGKSSTPPLFRNIFFDFAKQLAGVDSAEKLENARSKALDILRKHTTALRHGEFSVQDMEYRVKAWKATKERDASLALSQPYQAIQQLKDRGITVKQRAEVGFVKVKSFRYGKRTFTVKPTQMATKHDIDIPDYVRKLEMAFQQVLEPLQIQFPRKPSVALDAFLSAAEHEPFTKNELELEQKPSTRPGKRQKQISDFSEQDK